ncbi:MoxR family ATPase [Alginatibacterium sediminis]|uniref:MoxR family ATPase n=1 Tax=Alginatibacterium sediminis TaxID=2164068 RepID=A0A420EI82_9ALTE|nr:MoxR family ATPase [Alginatibacterium sediminis]RKF20357.1 MoxR family ATPase [Alginatibacterium sediminis]
MSLAYQSIIALEEQLNKSVIGQENVVRALILSLISGGHVLLEGLPGTAKTRSVKLLAENLNIAFGRIQFTPDLLPSDVTGSEVYREVNGKPDLSFKPGPIFNSIVLADEINRAPAKVQAALLEAMEEKTVTAAGVTNNLPNPFMVLATQNPIEQEGTYPLPEAQMDRFLMKVEVFYPDADSELDIIRLVRSEEQDAKSDNDSNQAQPHFDINTVLEGKEAIKTIHISETVEKYIVDLVMATRKPELYPNGSLSRWISVGASPRASIALDRCARASAWIEGRDFVSPDDVRAVIHAVLGHRITLTFDAAADSISSKEVINEILDLVVLA